MDKQSLRIWAKNKRKELDIVHISAILSDKLVQSDEYRQAKNIMIFYPLKDEINLLSILQDSSKQFYLPRINGDSMECCPYKTGDELCKSCFHTKEPVCNACEKSIIDLVIAPALCCDKSNYRLGYGGGFYDRFLKDYKGIKIVCIAKELIIDSISPGKQDVKMDLVLTD